MAVTSARPAVTAAPFALQYSSNIERDADPQPSSVWFTNGTSSHTPALPWHRETTALARKTASSKPRANRWLCVRERLQRKDSAERQREKKDPYDNQDDPQQVAIRQRAGGKIPLRLAGLIGQLREILIA